MEEVKKEGSARRHAQKKNLQAKDQASKKDSPAKKMAPKATQAVLKDLRPNPSIVGQKKGSP